MSPSSVATSVCCEGAPNQRLLLAGAHVLKELVFVRQRAYALRATSRLARERVARSRNAIR